ncbi:MAG: ATP-binding protein [Sulfolobales archaeon]
MSHRRESDNELIGYVIGESKPHGGVFLAIRPPMLGEYVEIRYDKYQVIGLIQGSISGSLIIDEEIPASDIGKIASILRIDNRSVYHKGFFRILGDIESLKIPPIAPPPGTEVYRASSKTLAKIFSPEDPRWCRVGTLLRNPEVEVRVDLSKMLQRHLAIIAMTGMGKSNLVALLSREITRRRGTVIIFDYHGEYKDLRFNGEYPNLLEVQLNPRYLSWQELSRILGVRPGAKNQELIVRLCKSKAEESRDKLFLEQFLSCVKAESVRASRSEMRDAAQAILDLIEANKFFLKNLLSDSIRDVIDQIVLSKINVLDLTGLTMSQIDAVVSHWLHRVLEERKRVTWLKRSGEKPSKGLVHPVMIFLEEAHIYLSTDRETLSRYRAELIVREGRKFGVGLGVVSQRPRGLDPDVISQIGSWALMRIIQPEDQVFVSRVSEYMTNELIEQLPSLNIGEAILVGQWIRVPAIVKIDHVAEKVSGVDIDPVREWLENSNTLSP